MSLAGRGVGSCQRVVRVARGGVGEVRESFESDSLTDAEGGEPCSEAVHMRVQPLLDEGEDTSPGAASVGALVTGRTEEQEPIEVRSDQVFIHGGHLVARDLRRGAELAPRVLLG